jgi:hypothetical protein
MMADARDEDRTGDLLVQEVDEDLRREQYLNLWRRYGVYVVAAMVAIVVVVAGYQGWKGWQADQRDKAAARYAAAIALVDAGKTKDGEDALAKIAGDGGGFAVLAGMRRAELLAQDGDTKGAVAAYEQLAASGAPELLRGLATLKAAMLILNAPSGAGIDGTAIEGRVDGLGLAGNPWYYQATELEALFARKKGDTAHAVELFKRLADDAQAPQGIRARAAEFLAALGPAAAIEPSQAAVKSGAAAAAAAISAAKDPAK